MRVAFVVHSFPVLSESFIVDQACGLLDRGHELEIIALYGDGDPAAAADPRIGDNRLLDRLTTCRVRDSFGRRIMGALPLIAREYRGRSALLGRVLDIREHGRAAISLKTLFMAPIFHRDKGFDIIHCQFGTLADGIVHLCASGILPAKAIVQFRGHDITEFVKSRGRRVYAPIFARADHFLANSDYFRDVAIDLGCDSARLDVLRSGVNTERFRLIERPAWSGGVLKLAVVGRLVEKKGIEYAIRAVGIAKSKRIPIQCRIIGEGPLRKSLARLIGGLGIADSVELLGAKPQSGVAALLEASDIFLATSVTAANGDQDGPVNTLKEAMLSGMPVIGTRHGGIPELIEDGVSGFLVDERDPDAIADRISALVADPASWAEMGRAGRRRVEADYDTNKVNDQLVSIYEKVIARSS